uniref:uncharacterized protein LOC117605916 n=1 Tax=Osmia lignaria TaxID=473952 RepID=UPI00147833EB|nr:uncharacterized protein LOC117605916 [Osmia lignaria]
MDIAQSLQNALQRSTRATENLVGLFEPTKKKWSDNLLTQLVRDLNFPSTAYRRTEKPRILKRFFRFYIVGAVDKLDSVVGILNDVIAIGSTRMGLIWKAPNKKEQVFYPKNTSDPPSLGIYNQKFNMTLAESQLNEFQNCLHKVLEEIDPESPETGPEKCVVRLAMFLALTLYRFATRNAIQMEKAFKETQYKKNLINLTEWPARHPFSPPCSACLTICERALAKGLKSTSNLFIKVVHEFVLTKKAGYPDPNVAEILDAALLTDTARNGMGMIELLYHVQLVTQMKWKVIMAKTYNTLTCTSWENLVTFFAQQTNIDNPQYSYHWARIIDNDYFKELTSDNNVFLAAVFTSAIASKNSEREIDWDANDATYLGKVLYDMSQSLDGAETAPAGVDLKRRALALRNRR